MRVSQKFFKRVTAANINMREVAFTRSWSNMDGEPEPVRLNLHGDEEKFCIRMTLDDAVQIRTFLDNAITALESRLK